MKAESKGKVGHMSLDLWWACQTPPPKTGFSYIPEATTYCPLEGSEPLEGSWAHGMGRGLKEQETADLNVIFFSPIFLQPDFLAG